MFPLNSPKKMSSDELYTGSIHCETIFPVLVICNAIVGVKRPYRASVTLVQAIWDASDGRQNEEGVM